MKIIFVLLCIKVGDNNMYSKATEKLVDEILSQTQHDILLSTNSLELIEKFTDNSRVIVRDNITNANITIKYAEEFNYNLKYLAFQDIPENYDLVIYLDCDIKLDGWGEDTEKYLTEMFIDKDHDFGATRLNCYLSTEVNQHRTTGRALFSHKIQSYNILDYADDHDIMLSRLPSEHFLIFRNDTAKMKKFHSKWEELNNHLQSIDGRGGSWGDGFEIGISARCAGFHNPLEIAYGTSVVLLGFQFNGNKY